MKFCSALFFVLFFLGLSISTDAETVSPLTAKQQALLKLLLPSATDNYSAESSYINKSLSVPVSFAISVSDQPKSGVNANTLNVPMRVSDLNAEKMPIIPNSGQVSFFYPLIKLQLFAVLGSSSHTQLIIQTDHAVYYTLSSNFSHQKLTLTLEDIHPGSILRPININNTALQNIHFDYNQYHQLVITLYLSPMTEIQGLRMTGDQQSELVMNLGIGPIPAISLLKSISSQGPYKPLVKTLSAETVSTQLLSQKYRQALYSLEQHHARQALEILTGMRVQISRQPLAVSQEYYTLLAETYRQLSMPLPALEIYQTLLNMNANNSLWWAGLGICFEMLDQKARAQEAYLKAQSLGDLPLSLSHYISQRLAAYGSHEKLIS